VSRRHLRYFGWADEHKFDPKHRCGELLGLPDFDRDGFYYRGCDDDVSRDHRGHKRPE